MQEKVEKDCRKKLKKTGYRFPVFVLYHLANKIVIQYFFESDLHKLSDL